MMFLQKRCSPRTYGGHLIWKMIFTDVIKKAKKAVPQEDPHITHLLVPQEAASRTVAQIPSEERPQEKQARPLHHPQIPPGHRICYEEDGRQHTRAHYGCRGQI